MSGSTDAAVVPEAVWSGRFSGQVHELFKRFNDSLPFDRRLFPEDIAGSAAWARALERAGVLDPVELRHLESALQSLHDDVAADPALFDRAVAEAARAAS